jgi:adenylate cyclase
MLSLSDLRDCMEGVIPATVATCAPDGTPNVSYISQVHYVDEKHVALSYQFFSKTRQNILANPRASLLAISPQTGAQYRFELEYLRTETGGPLFESMKAKLAGIASHEGMTGVFRLLGSDVYRLTEVNRIPGGEIAAPPRPNLLPVVRAISDRVTRASDLATLLDDLMNALGDELGIRHAMILLQDAASRRLYTVASRGYERSGVGAEVALDEGVIGVAAQMRTPIRLTHAAAEYSYSRAIRERAKAGGLAEALTAQIPFAGLPDSRSQLAVPICAGPQLLGALYVESPEDLRFRYDDEDALATIAGQLGMAIRFLQDAPEHEDADAATRTAAPAMSGTAAVIRHYAVNDSIFIDDDYLIKGVAGAIFWKLLRDYTGKQRVEFTNRELRLDPSIRLPELSENLEARLILLSRRLAERCPFLRLEKAGRGRIRLVVARPLQLVAMAGADAA